MDANYPHEPHYATYRRLSARLVSLIQEIDERIDLTAEPKDLEIVLTELGAKLSSILNPVKEAIAQEQGRDFPVIDEEKNEDQIAARTGGAMAFIAAIGLYIDGKILDLAVGSNVEKLQNPKIKEEMFCEILKKIERVKIYQDLNEADIGVRTSDQLGEVLSRKPPQNGLS